jgi:gamma-glutamyl:cysteine ligase YbdK (ATP-grasp superfamily)
VSAPLRLGEGHGLELELAIVDRETLDVRPLAERVLFAASGDESGDHDNGRISWSNELVRHVLELKTSAPEPSFVGLAAAFQANVLEVLRRLEPLGAVLMPGGMHPWMDPARETELWPFAYGEVYRAYDRIFGCRTHGWANLQSVHLNLSFGDAEEFARLHAAARLVLPLVPALAASSPVCNGRVTGLLDQRLEVYRTNAVRVPRMTGAVVPEPVFEPEAYRREILAPLEREVAALDPSGTLEGEWLNARGAIARFDRGALELRLTDVQENPRADVAVAWALAAVVAALVDERWCSRAAQRAFATEPLAALLVDAIRRGPAARVVDPAHARALGWTRGGTPTLGELWDALLASAVVDHPGGAPELLEPLQTIRQHGTLSERLLRTLGAAPSRARLRGVYAELCACLAEARPFLPSPLPTPSR